MLARLYMRIDLAQDENDLKAVLEEANTLMACGYFSACERMGLVLRVGRKVGTLA